MKNPGSMAFLFLIFSFASFILLSDETYAATCRDQIGSDDAKWGTGSVRGVDKIGIVGEVEGGGYWTNIQDLSYDSKGICRTGAFWTSPAGPHTPFDGERCVALAGKSTTYVSPEGKLDISESQCVVCGSGSDSKKQYDRIGNTQQIDWGVSTGQGLYDIPDTCESACGASQECDEKNSREMFTFNGVQGSCDSTCNFVPTPTLTASISQTPESPTTADTIRIDAVASSSEGKVEKVQIYIDNQVAFECATPDFNVRCIVERSKDNQQFSVGEHAYYAIASAGAKTVTTDTKRFTVSVAPTCTDSDAPSVNNYINDNPKLKGTCAVNDVPSGLDTCVSDTDYTTGVGTSNTLKEYICADDKKSCVQVGEIAKQYTKNCKDFGSTWICKDGACMDNGTAITPPVQSTACTGTAKISITSTTLSNGAQQTYLSIENAPAACNDVIAKYSAKSDCTEPSSVQCPISSGTCDVGLAKPTTKTTFYACIDMDKNNAYAGSEISSGVDLDPTTGTTTSPTGSGTAGTATPSTAPATCNNGQIDSGERCDGSAVGSQTCASQGFGGGTLRCANDCLEYDRTACEGKPPAGFTGAPMPTKDGNLVKMDFTAHDEYIWKYAFIRPQGKTSCPPNTPVNASDECTSWPDEYITLELTGNAGPSGWGASAADWRSFVAQGDLSKVTLTAGTWEIFPAGCVFKGSQDLFHTYIASAGGEEWVCGFNKPLVYTVA